ncbi:MAG: LamG domain-containing protein, partial [Planctomycetota bacterium]
NASAPNDINFASVGSVYIGFGDRFNPVAGGAGVVYFDDLRVSMPFCNPQYGPTGDLSGDCFVGVADIGEMGYQWLRRDVNANPVTAPSDANLVAHWKLDGDANDSSANAYHGTVKGAYDWTTGQDGQAIDLAGGWVVVEDEGNTPKLRPKHHVSVMAWINRVQASSDAIKVVIKGRDDRETYGLEVNQDYEGLSFIMRDANEWEDDKPKLYDIEGERKLPRREWIHIAGTYDGNEMTSYVNGEVEGTRTPGPNELYADVNDGLGIGGRYGSGADFEGKIDDVRVYDRAVTRAEIAYIASGGDGLIPLESEANFYSGEDPEVIDFKDYATLFDYWGDEQLWPPLD